jgi:hypothetical protein
VVCKYETGEPKYNLVILKTIMTGNDLRSPPLVLRPDLQSPRRMRSYGTFLNMLRNWVQLDLDMSVRPQQSHWIGTYIAVARRMRRPCVCQVGSIRLYRAQSSAQITAKQRVGDVRRNGTLRGTKYCVCWDKATHTGARFVNRRV